MTVARIYIMHASETAALESALETLADAVRPLPGCDGIELLRDLGNEKRFLFIEKWASEEDHKNAGSMLPKDVMTAIGAALDGPPDGAYFDYLKVV